MCYRRQGAEKGRSLDRVDMMKSTNKFSYLRASSLCNKLKPPLEALASGGYYLCYLINPPPSAHHMHLLQWKGFVTLLFANDKGQRMWNDEALGKWFWVANPNRDMHSPQRLNSERGKSGPVGKIYAYKWLTNQGHECMLRYGMWHWEPTEFSRYLSILDNGEAKASLRETHTGVRDRIQTVWSNWCLQLRKSLGLLRGRQSNNVLSPGSSLRESLLRCPSLGTSETATRKRQ